MVVGRYLVDYIHSYQTASLNLPIYFAIKNFRFLLFPQNYKLFSLILSFRIFSFYFCQFQISNSVRIISFSTENMSIIIQRVALWIDHLITRIIVQQTKRM